MVRHFSHEWLAGLGEVLSRGDLVAPRGQLTREIPQRTMVVDMRRPVLTVAKRGLNYRFMAAEAFWILSGDDRVETIAPYNSRIAAFSDDGERFFGAYGPKVVAQLPYVIGKLVEDRGTRQAGLTLWRESPPATKDVPCTVAMFFNLRGMALNMSVYMRSSDLWLGVPYDVFNFSMVAHLVCAKLNEQRGSNDLFTPGRLYLTAASQHVYETNWTDAQSCVAAPGVTLQDETPQILWNDERGLMDWLSALRDSRPGSELRWWEKAV